MTVEYKREMNRNYMVIKPDLTGSGKYAVKMLSENQIPGLLSFHEKKLDDKNWFYYDITSRQPLTRLLEVRPLAGSEIRQILSDILFTLKQMERFFLDEGQLELKPDCIYVEPETFRCFLCLIPGRYQNFAEKFGEFTKYLLDHVCHTDTEAVVLAFGVFQESRKENFGMENLERLMKQNQTAQNSAAQSPARQNSDIQDSVRQNPARQDPSGQKLNKPDFKSKMFGDPGQELSEEDMQLPELYVQKKLYMGEDEKSTGSAGRRQGRHSEKDRKAGNEGRERKTEKHQKKSPQADFETDLGADKKKRFKTVIMGLIFLVMVLFPAGLAVRNGLLSLLRYKWIVAGVEICMGILALAVRNSEEEQESDQEAGQTARDWHRESVFAEKMFDGRKESCQEKAKQTKDNIKSGGNFEEWETMLCRDDWAEETGDTEFETVLLTADPVNNDCRRLVPVSGGGEILISYYPFIIGKNRELSDYCMDDSAVSRLHLRIDKTENDYTVTDLNSTNGTWVEGRRLNANESCELKVGEKVEIAGRVFHFL